MRILWNYCEITVRLLLGYVRLLCDYCEIVVRLLWDYCKLTVRLLWDYCEFSVKLLSEWVISQDKESPFGAKNEKSARSLKMNWKMRYQPVQEAYNGFFGGVKFEKSNGMIIVFPPIHPTMQKRGGGWKSTINSDSAGGCYHQLIIVN